MIVPILLVLLMIPMMTVLADAKIARWRSRGRQAVLQDVRKAAIVIWRILALISFAVFFLGIVAPYLGDVVAPFLARHPLLCWALLALFTGRLWWYCDTKRMLTS